MLLILSGLIIINYQKYAGKANINPNPRKNFQQNFE